MVLSSFLLAEMSWSQAFLCLLIVGVCLLLILVVLLQRGRGGGLSGAFGGAGGSSAFGAKTGDVFTWITVVVAGVFVLLSVVAGFVFDESALAEEATPAAVAPLLPPADGTTAPGGMPLIPTPRTGTDLPISVEFVPQTAGEEQESAGNETAPVVGDGADKDLSTGNTEGDTPPAEGTPDDAPAGGDPRAEEPASGAEGDGGGSG